MATSNNEPPGRLINHFANSDLWDRGRPSTALIDFITLRPGIIDQLGSGRRPTALVPGCGRGYDVVMLALHGFDAVGLEVSQNAIDSAKAYAETELSRPSAYNFADEDSRDRFAAVQPGSVNFVRGDFFQRGWETSCLAGCDDQGFDLIYDYTFLCALLPEMRRDWAQRTRELLGSKGVLVCLEFPLYKDLMAPGPPWGLQGVYWDLLAEGGDGKMSGPITATNGGRGPFERVTYIKPPRSYEMGRGTDMLSVWALRK
ncbi:putative thiol methyltransferase 2 [Cladorrhinum sp. PSN259]|nr:putative thiol methyltransferase 2 [Cladorrhinum sp. PSN259]